MGILVQTILTLEESQYAAYRGVERHWNALKAHADPHKYGFNGDNLHIHIDGALAEKAVSKLTKASWDDGPWKPVSWDVGHLQVRSTKLSNGSLILRPHDDENDVFLLVIDNFPTYTIVGWITCKDGKQLKWRRAPNGRPPAWFIPQSDLQPIKTLINHKQ